MAIYNYERNLLAIECAEVLKLKPLSPNLMEYGLKVSDFAYDKELSEYPHGSLVSYPSEEQMRIFYKKPTNNE